MTIGPREVMRSEVEGGLSGPANPIPNKSIDCGCTLLPCPKLAKFATRRLFVGLLCWVGIVQAASHSYMYITSSTIARRFQIDPNLMEWILIVAELTPVVLGFPVAYWGDRIHRAAWTGALVLLQSAGFVSLIIPNFTHVTRTIEEPENITHMSIYAENNPDLCSPGLTRSMMNEIRPCHTILGLLIGVQILTGIANVAYYALGISYLDDNTRKRNVAGLISIVVAVKIIGLLLGYFLAWGCLRLDSKDLGIVESYREKIGAWWLGWPILACLLVIPGTLISWLPRRLPSEVVEQAAASILDLAGRASPMSCETVEPIKVGGIGYLSSLARLFGNKILAFNVLAVVCCTTALVSFATNENLILESRYHVPTPAGMLLGFSDPLWARLIANMVKPIIIGLIIIISGLVISRVRPRARSLAIYNAIVLVLAATMIFSLAYTTCEKPPIFGEEIRSLSLSKYCNKDCHCSKYADFHPVCGSNRGYTFYSPCHAGCRTVEEVGNVKIYGSCSCIEDKTGLGNTQAKEGACTSSTCQIGWLVFEMGTLVTYCLAASSIVGSLLIALRCVYIQDKALTIGFWLTFVSAFAYVPTKLVYQKIADMNCKHWGRGSTCHLHDGNSLGDYMCYLTALLLILAAIFEIILSYFCRELRLFGCPISELPRETELQKVETTQAVPLLEENSAPSNGLNSDTVPTVQQTVVIESTLDLQEQRLAEDSHQESAPLRYGPLGPGDRRTDTAVKDCENHEDENAKMRSEDTDDELDSSSDEEKRDTKKLLGSSPRVAYLPLELDSDVESDLSSIGPRSRKRVSSHIFDDLPKDYQVNVTSPLNKRPFPNPDDYENPSGPSAATGKTPQPNGRSSDNVGIQGGFSRTNSFEFATSRDKRKSREGDFNEVGIPVMQPLVAASFLSSSSPSSPEASLQGAQVLLPAYQKNVSQDRLETLRALLDSVDETRKHHLEKDVLPEDDEEKYPDTPPPIIGRPPSRDPASSGFGSLLDMGDKNEIVSLLPGQVKIAKKNPGPSRTSSPKDGPPRGGPVSTAF